MTAGVFDEPYAAQGKGWEAEIQNGQVLVSVEPDSDDALDSAIEELLAPTQRRFWSVRYIGCGSTGRDLWMLEREGSAILADALGLRRWQARRIIIGNDLVTVVR